MANTRLEQLLQELLKSTDTGLVRWGETADENSFRIGLGGGMVRVDQHQGDYYASLIDPQGRIVESVEQNDTKVNLGRLFSLARGSALNVDGLLEKMFADLRGGKVVTPPPEKVDKDDIPF